MPQGRALVVPDDGLTTRARRNIPVLAVHTGAGKGKSTAAFGMALRAWNAGMSVAVFQFVKSAKWKVGEESAFAALGRLHDENGAGGPVEWHKMGSGWSWSRKSGSDDDHAAAAADGWAEIARRIGEQRHDFYVLDEFTYPLKWLGARGRRGRGAALAAGRPRRDHRARRTPAAARRRRPGDRDDQGQTPDGRRPQRPARDRMVSVPAVVIGAPSSGSGKTTIATGLIGALRKAGHRVAPFKVGPDFIDPGYHALAASRPGRNLDSVLVSEDLIGPLYRHGSRDADIAVVEGVMGLFDGRIDTQASIPARGSTAQVAELLGAPVVLVVDARGQSQSIGAVLQGFSTFHPGTHVAG
jgi:cob(I)alamin adenosyltransferase